MKIVHPQQVGCKTSPAGIVLAGPHDQSFALNDKPIIWFTCLIQYEYSTLLFLYTSSVSVCLTKLAYVYNFQIPLQLLNHKTVDEVVTQCTLGDESPSWLIQLHRLIAAQALSVSFSLSQKIRGKSKIILVINLHLVHSELQQWYAVYWVHQVHFVPATTMTITSHLS